MKTPMAAKDVDGDDDGDDIDVDGDAGSCNGSDVHRPECSLAKATIAKRQRQVMMHKRCDYANRDEVFLTRNQRSPASV